MKKQRVNSKPELVRTQKAADQLGVSNTFIRNLLWKKRLRRYRLEGITFIDLRELQMLIKPTE